MTSPTSTSVAIPMHASKRFIDVISANIAALPEDVEIILSDHTCVDDAIERLQERHGDDRRIRFVRETDGIGVIDHYNRLLREANGDYFMWMPHDDTFPPEYIPLLRGALERNPDANLAFGSLRPIDLDGELIEDKVGLCESAPIELGQLTRVEEATYLWDHWSLWIPYRGLMRRREVLRHRLFVRRGLQEHYHDITWVFAMTMLARIVYVPESVCEKRYFPGSHHTLRQRRAIDELWDVVTIARYMIAARIPPRDAVEAMKYTARRALWRACAHLPEGVRFSFPKPVRRMARSLLAP